MNHSLFSLSFHKFSFFGPSNNFILQSSISFLQFFPIFIGFPLLVPSSTAFYQFLTQCIPEILHRSYVFIKNHDCRLYQCRSSLPPDQSQLYETVVRRIHGETTRFHPVGRPRHQVLREHGRLRLSAQGELFRFREEIWILQHGQDIPLLFQQNAPRDRRRKVQL